MLCPRFGVVLVLFAAQTTAEKCTTPNNEEGECVTLYSCPALLDKLATRQNASLEFVRKSNCGYAEPDLLVCCASSSTNGTGGAKNNSVPKVDKVKKDDLIPNKQYCGFQQADNFFHEGNDTRIDEFPWLAELKYNNSIFPALKPKCGGTLITNKYVLTAGHCTRQFNVFIPRGVRLGEHNIKTNRDCENSQFEDDCNDPPEDFGIEAIIIHPDYFLRFKLHDIALLRLDRQVTYTDYIRPICLPTPGTTMAQVGDTLTATGWGLIPETQETKATKAKILTKIITNAECEAEQEKFLTTDRFCTRELGTTTVCDIDSGSPVMFSTTRKRQWHLEGVSSFGIGCDSTANARGVHIKVANYLDWIKDNIKP